MTYDVICIGMALVDSIIRGFDPKPVSASGYVVQSGSLNAGGEAVNEAVAAAKLGMRTGILCALGDDAAGEIVLNELKKNGVDIRLVVKSETTPVTTMFVRADGTRKSVTNRAHRYNFHPEKEPALFTDAKAVILGSLFRAPFDDPEILYAVVSGAKKAGQLVVADTKLPNFRFLTLEDILDSLEQIDYLDGIRDKVMKAKMILEEHNPSLISNSKAFRFQEIYEGLKVSKHEAIEKYYQKAIKKYTEKHTAK